MNASTVSGSELQQVGPLSSTVAFEVPSAAANTTRTRTRTPAPVMSGAPHGGSLVSTYVDDEAKRAALVAECTAEFELSERQACDVSLLINGGFSPLEGFMKKADYDSVVENMRLESGTLFGLPVVLDVADKSLEGKKVLLKYKGTDLAVLEAEEVYQPDKVKEAKNCMGTSSVEHPTVAELFSGLAPFYAGGKVHG